MNIRKFASVTWVCDLGSSPGRVTWESHPEESPRRFTWDSHLGESPSRITQWSHPPVLKLLINFKSHNILRSLIVTLATRKKKTTRKLDLWLGWWIWMRNNYKTVKTIFGSLLNVENHYPQTSQNVKIQCRKRNANNIKLEEIARKIKSGKNAEGLVANAKVINSFL